MAHSCLRQRFPTLDCEHLCYPISSNSEGAGMDEGTDMVGSEACMLRTTRGTFVTT